MNENGLVFAILRRWGSGPGIYSPESKKEQCGYQFEA